MLVRPYGDGCYASRVMNVNAWFAVRESIF